jgi:hypothetical protein
MTQGDQAHEKNSEIIQIIVHNKAVFPQKEICELLKIIIFLI